MLLQVLYRMRSERALMDQIDLNLGYRWFAGLGQGEPVWDASTFSKNPGTVAERRRLPRSAATA